MQPIPSDILTQFEAVLKRRSVPLSRHMDYRKWLRYYLDFHSKYPLPDSRPEQVRLFIQKLRKKKQTPVQQKQAAHALSLYFESLQKIYNKIPLAQINTEKRIMATTPSTPRSESEFSRFDRSRSDPSRRPASGVASPLIKPEVGALSRKSSKLSGSRYNKWRCLEKSVSPDWDRIIGGLADEIKTRHYSRKTLKAYADWSRKFQSYLKNKPPDELSEADVKVYLTYLAVNCKVSASTQNQAFNALLFLYRHILKKDFGDHKDIPRAKKSKYIPVVLSRKEIDAVLKHLSHPYDLAVKLLYGCGLRLFECVKLRVKNFNFDAGILTLHGKGSKDRTVPIPQKIMPELTSQFELIKKLHDEDLAAGYAGVFLEGQLEKKYPKATKDFI